MYSNDIKNLAIKLYYKYNNYRKVQQIINIGKSTINRWVNQVYYQTKSFYKLNIHKIIDIIKKFIKDNKFFKLIDIKRYLNNSYNINISISFIYTILTKKIKFSYKKISNQYYYKNDNSLQLQKEKFTNDIKNIDINNIISIDETYFYNNDNIEYAWSNKGDKIFHKKYSHRIKYSMIMAISNNKILYYELHKTSINTQLFNIFLNNFKPYMSNDSILLMDNVSFHRSKIIKDNITNPILFIPPYSPEYNPIEFIFSIIKKKYKYLNTFNTDYYNNIINSLNIEDVNIFKNIYNHCLNL